MLPIRNLQADPRLPASAQVSVDFLQLVRYGLRSPDDPLILGSVKLADALLKVQTPAGPCWHRYNEDGYGEHDDGSAYDGTGRGRPWPLLTGERGHYELCAGRDALPLPRDDGAHGVLRRHAAGAGLGQRADPGARTCARAAHGGGDAARVGARGVPEACRLAGLSRPFDRPAAVWERYRGERPLLTRVLWTEQAPVAQHSRRLRAHASRCASPAPIRWGLDGWQDVREQETRAEPAGPASARDRHPAAARGTHARLHLS